MPAKKPYTPNSKIRQALRILTLRSREYHEAYKATNYCCSYCGVKKSEANGRVVKLEMHHLDPIQWQEIFDVVRKTLIPNPSRLAPACKKCHDEQTAKQTAERKG